MIELDERSGCAGRRSLVVILGTALPFYEERNRCGAIANGCEIRRDPLRQDTGALDS